VAIASIRVEAWTRDERGAGTDGRIECTIGFAGLAPIVAILDRPGIDDFRRGGKERFELVLDAAHREASARDITGVMLRNLDEDRAWIAGAVGLWVDDRVVLSRVVHAVLPPAVIELPVVHDGRLEGLEVRLRTAAIARDEFLNYWGNPDLGWRRFGVASRITLGRLDVYVMDGRFRRVAREPTGVMFSAEQCQQVLAEIDRRATALGPRLVGLATGTPWTASEPRLARDPADYEPFAHGIYATERRLLFDGLRARIDTGAIRGLFLLSGDFHAHEVFEVELGGGRVAPELMCSPMTRNAPESGNPLIGERRYSRGVDPADGLYAGFGVLSFDTTADEPNGNWTVRVDYRRHDDGAVFFTHTYTVIDNQLRW
jgi:hypothetical protein